MSDTKSTGIKLDVNTCPLNRPAMIRASAGTGKTYTITYLVLRLLLGSGGENAYAAGPLDIRSLLIVTFTNAAAADLRARVREKIREGRIVLEELARSGEIPEDTDDHLKQLIAEMERLKVPPRECARRLLEAERGIDDAAICTIHSFCDQALNKVYSFEAGEAFEMELTGDISDQQQRAAREIWRELFYESDRERGQALLKLMGTVSPSGLRGRILDLGKVRVTGGSDAGKVMEWAVRGYGFENLGKELKGCGERGLFNKIRALGDEYSQKLEELDGSLNDAYAQVRASAPGCKNQADLADSFNDNGSVTLYADSGRFLDLVLANEHLTDPEKLRRLIDNGKDNTLKIFKNKNGQAAAETPRGRQLLASCRELQKAAAQRHSALEGMSQVLKTLAAMLVILRTRALCRQDRVLSFDDLISSLDKALHKKGSGPKLAQKLRARYPVAMIDEFQDTDPVQFSVFRELYLTEEAKHDRAVCFLIGDPKQSIYAFRNADVHSYLRAGAEISRIYPNARNGQDYFTLGTNFRSDRGVVESVNDIFGGFKDPESGEVVANADPFFEKNGDPHERIGYERVTAHASGKGFCGKLRFYFDGLENSTAGCFVNFVEDMPSSAGKTNTDKFCARDAAQCVRDLLDYGYLVPDKGQRRRVRPSDIAVLVRGATENAKIADALQALDRPVPSVYFSDRGSVLNHPEESFQNKNQEEKKVLANQCASDMLCLMEAVQDFENRSAVLRLLGTRLSGLTPDEFFEYASGEGDLEEVIALLRRCALSWGRYGFLSAFSLWARERGLISWQLGVKGGERALTDYYQTAEIIQAHRQEFPGTEAQLRWFRDQLTVDESDNETLRKRLESENDQVKVITIHKSKGLEFPVTVLPFMWGRTHLQDQDGPVIFYDAAQGQRTRVVSLDNAPIDNGPGESVTPSALKKTEDEQEEARLLYVALTRACGATFLFVNRDNLSRGASALVKETVPGAADSAVAYDQAKKLFDSCPETYCVNYRETLQAQLAGKTKNPEGDLVNNPQKKDLKPSAIEKGTVRADFSVSSYTALTAGLHDHDFDEGIEVQNAARQERRTAAAEPDRFSFPRGTQAGTFLHTLLEHCNFHEAGVEGSGRDSLHDLLRTQSYAPVAGALFSSWGKRALRDGMPKPEKSLQDFDYLEPLQQWFEDIINAKILSTPEGGFSLGMLESGGWIPEMDYLIPTGAVSSEAVNALCLESAQEVLGRRPELTLKPSMLHGFVTGSLDLVFRAPGEDGRMKYYVADYKSTYLGPDFSAYSEDAVRQSVFDPHNRYDVQYLIYTLALQRFLKSRIHDYSYERDFGGVLYLYLRGLKRTDEGLSPGIFFTRPSFEIVQRLDRLFKRENTHD